MVLTALLAMGLQGAESDFIPDDDGVRWPNCSKGVPSRSKVCAQPLQTSSGSERSYDTFETDRIMAHDDPICTQLVVPGARILQGYAMMTWEPLQHWFIVPRDVEDGWNINSHNAVSLPRSGLRLGYHP